MPHSIAELDESQAAEPAAGQTMAADEFERLPKYARKYELIGGKVQMSPAGLEHDRIVARLIIRIGLHLEHHPFGEVYASSAGFRVAESDVLSPDVSFVRAEQLPGGRSPEGFGRFAPDLAVEVVSPGDRAAEIEEKVNLYLAYGTRLVWVINPRARSAMIYRADGSAARVKENGALDGETVLPGFACPLAAIL